MNIKQYHNFKDWISDNIFGQRIGLIYVDDFSKNLAKDFKDQSIYKLSIINAYISKRSYYELANTSTGLRDLGVTLNPKRESHYNYEKLNGFLSNLKTNPEKKYVLIRYDSDPERKNIHIIKTVYVRPDTREIMSEETVESMMTPSALKKKRNEYGRAGKLNLSVGFRAFKWANIARLRVSGYSMTDNHLQPFLEYLGMD